MTPIEAKLRRREIEESIKDRKASRANALTTSRAAMLTEGAKMLAVINGAGAAALTTLMTALWDKGGIAPVRHAIVWAIGLLVLGAALAAISFWPRYLHGLSRMATRPLQSKWWWVNGALLISAFLLFVIAMTVVLIAIYNY